VTAGLLFYTANKSVQTPCPEVMLDFQTLNPRTRVEIFPHHRVFILSEALCVLRVSHTLAAVINSLRDDGKHGLDVYSLFCFGLDVYSLFCFYQTPFCWNGWRSTICQIFISLSLSLSLSLTM